MTTQPSTGEASTTPWRPEGRKPLLHAGLAGGMVGSLRGLGLRLPCRPFQWMERRYAERAERWAADAHRFARHRVPAISSDSAAV